VFAGGTAGSLAAILSEIEELKSSADALESELSAVSAVAEGAAKRSRRLAARSHELQVCCVRGCELVPCISRILWGGGMSRVLGQLAYMSSSCALGCNWCHA
jgi:hypothetical protein